MSEKKRLREKVVAEITLAHLTQCAQEMGRELTTEEAVEFLNQNGRAYELWKRMMQAGEDYMKSALQTQKAVPIPRTGTARGRIAV